jgi:hypothetical protein
MIFVFFYNNMMMYIKIDFYFYFSPSYDQFTIQYGPLLILNEWQGHCI